MLSLLCLYSIFCKLQYCKKCNIVLLGISLSESCHFCQSHFCHFRFWKQKNSSIKNIYIYILYRAQNVFFILKMTKMTLTKMTRFYLNLSSILCVLILSFCHFLVFYNFLIFSMKIKIMGTFQHKVRTNYCKKLLFVVSLQKKNLHSAI